MTTPIFRLIRQIEDEDIGLRTCNLITKLGVKTVEGLAKYSVPYLKSQTADPDAVVGELGRLLETRYNLTFSESYKT